MYPQSTPVFTEALSLVHLPSIPSLNFGIFACKKKSANFFLAIIVTSKDVCKSFIYFIFFVNLY